MYKKSPLLIIIILFLIGCGSGKNNLSNSGEGNQTITTAHRIVDDGIKLDLNSVINGTWKMSVIDTNYNYLQEALTKNVIFDNATKTLTKETSDIKDKFGVNPLFQYDYANDAIIKSKNECEGLGHNFVQTMIVDGTPVYIDLYEMMAIYEIVKENNLDKFLIHLTGRNFRECCETSPGACDGADYTGPMVTRTIKFLILGVTSDGFVLQHYNSETTLENSIVVFTNKQ